MPAVLDLDVINEQKTEEQIRSEYAWLVAIYLRNNNYGTNVDYSTRMTGQWAEALVTYVLTGTLKVPVSKPHHSDMVPLMNVYRIAPAHVKELIEPIITNWKAEANQAPDSPYYSGASGYHG